MTATISKWGNSQALRLPTEVMKSLELHVGDKVEIDIEAHKLIITPLKKTRIKKSLDDLIQKIPPTYQAQEAWGEPMGKEVW